jgi:hypothetical protein
MAGIVRGHETLSAQLEKYLKGIEVDKDKGVTSDPMDKWHEVAMNLPRDILQKASGYGRDMANEKEDALGPLRRAMGKVASLSEAVSKARRRTCQRRRAFMT